MCVVGWEGSDKRVLISLEETGVELIRLLWSCRDEFLDKSAWEVKSGGSTKSPFEKSVW